MKKDDSINLMIDGGPSRVVRYISKKYPQYSEVEAENILVKISISRMLEGEKYFHSKNYIYPKVLTRGYIDKFISMMEKSHKDDPDV